jgi:hypothetical protein
MTTFIYFFLLGIIPLFCVIFCRVNIIFVVNHLFDLIFCRDFKKSFKDHSTLKESEEKIELFRAIRDEIKNWMENSFINNIKDNRK